jgi:hypothetical protein
MYASYTSPDPRVVLSIKTPPAPMVIDRFGLVDGKGYIDNGLGFGQGSVAGIIGQRYQCSGFQRPRLPGSDCEMRKVFNLHRLCTSPYARHFDPQPCSGSTPTRLKFIQL